MDDQTALMIYTSGGTSRPKGVLLSHENVIAGRTNTVQAHQLSAQDRSLCVLPLYHINAEMVSIMAIWSVAVAWLFVPDQAFPNSGTGFLTITAIDTVPYPPYSSI